MFDTLLHKLYEKKKQIIHYLTFFGFCATNIKQVLGSVYNFFIISINEI